jgi:hypothetical protein
MNVPTGAGAANTIKKLPCDHIFHRNCLRSWFQRQQTCPTCRTSILRLNPPNNTPQQPANGQPQQAQQARAAAAPQQQQQQQQQQANVNQDQYQRMPSFSANIDNRGVPMQPPLSDGNNRSFVQTVPNFLPPFSKQHSHLST